MLWCRCVEYPFCDHFPSAPSRSFLGNWGRRWVVNSVRFWRLCLQDDVVRHPCNEVHRLIRNHGFWPLPDLRQPKPDLDCRIDPSWLWSTTSTTTVTFLALNGILHCGYLWNYLGYNKVLQWIQISKYRKTIGQSVRNRVFLLLPFN